MQAKLLILISGILFCFTAIYFPQYLDQYISLTETLDKLILKNSSTANITIGS